MGPEDGQWILDEAAHPAGPGEHAAGRAGAGEHGAGEHGSGEYGGDPVAAAEAWLGGDEGQPGEARPTWERTRRDEAWPEGGWPDQDEPDDEWPADDWPAGPGDPPPEAGKRWGHGGFPGFSIWAAAAVAVLAAAAGVAVGLLLVKGTPTASAAGAATPSASAPTAAGPGRSGTGRALLPGPSGNGNGLLQMILTGRVLAVSATSITIGGHGPSVTAAVTNATKITGTVRGIAGVKAGHEVAARISGTPGHLTATAIQDPAGSSS